MDPNCVKTCATCRHDESYSSGDPGACANCTGWSKFEPAKTDGEKVSVIDSLLAQTKTAERDVPDDNPKTRFGLTKPAMSSVPPGALIHLMKAMADGRRKYGHMNWRQKTVSSTIYYDAAMRHLMAWFDGENMATDSGVHHLGHAMACLAIILDAAANERLNDDRPTPGRFNELVVMFTDKEPA